MTPHAVDNVLVCAALPTEARAVRGALRRLSVGVPVHVIGMQARRLGAATDSADAARLVVLLGYGGGLLPSQEPGDVVVAERILDSRGALVASGSEATAGAASALVDALEAAGLRVSRGPISCSDRVVHGAGRAELAAVGAVAVDMESAPLARALARGGGAAAGTSRLVVVRVLVDTPRRGVLRAVLLDGLRVRRRLRTAAAGLASWAAFPGEGTAGTPGRRGRRAPRRPNGGRGDAGAMKTTIPGSVLMMAGPGGTGSTAAQSVQEGS